jgi:hypothetical protein
MQPLDASFFGPLKSAYKRMLTVCAVIPSLFSTAYQKIATIAKRELGFAETGT